MIDDTIGPIEVLLPTFDGESFLPQQLDSLLAQRGVAWSVIARDDGSTDHTLEILQQYLLRHPTRIVLAPTSGRLGVVGSVNALLEKSTAPYVAFCDQDDVWKPDKLRILLLRMRVLESMHGKGTPILVHSDLEMVDHELRRLHRSFWAFSGADVHHHSLPRLLISNSVTGCAMIVNRALIRQAWPIPPEAAMHDHWFALVAAAFGHIESVDQTLVAYRQHSHNALGAHASGWRALLRRLRAGRWRKDICGLQRQAERFSARYGKELDRSAVELISGFSTLHQRSWAARRLFLLRHDILRSGVARNLMLLFFVQTAEDTW